jgi:peroxiredoxin Q/BCP
MAILSVGKKIPRCSLVDDKGVTHELRSLARTWLVLYFYPKDMTSGCTQQACEFTSSGGGFDAVDAAVVGVSPDSVKSHATFITKEKLGFRLLSDPPAADGVPAAAGAFGVWGTKSMYGREYQGIFRTTFLLDAEGTVRHVWEKVKVTGHAEEVLATIKAISGGAAAPASASKTLTKKPVAKKSSSKKAATKKPATKKVATKKVAAKPGASKSGGTRSKSR